MKKEQVIFIADDDYEFCMTLTGVLQKRNIRVRYETDPTRVMDRIKPEEDAVLLDMKFDGITGLDVLREIRAKYPYLPVILITGYVGERGSLVEKGLELSAFAYKNSEAFSADSVVNKNYKVIYIKAVFQYSNIIHTYIAYDAENG